VVHQELTGEKGIAVSLRTVEWPVEPWPQELRATALATVRCETPPGKQLQDDIGETYARSAGERAKVQRHERKVNWLLAMLVKEHEHARLVLVVNGWEFGRWEALEAYLERWSGEVVDVRIPGTCAEQPVVRLQRQGPAALQLMRHKPWFLA
jgi:hypothetical protein